MVKKRAIHLAPFNRNIGDNALNLAIERMLDPIFEIEQMELVANPFDDDVAARLDAADVVIFGGGGVIHSCSGDSSRKNREKSGTMWNMDLDRIRALRSKVVLYCVGYNRFQGEPEPLPAMGDFFSVLNEKKALVRFRNDGSLSRFHEYFPQFDGIRVAPDPGAFCRGDAPVADHVLIQIATDRAKFRFPGGVNKFVEKLNVFLERIPQKKILIPHTTSDGTIYDKIGKSLRVDEILPVRIGLDSTMEAMNLYHSALYTLSMRGHSQICSVGNGTPTFAISTHPKARGYMIDNGMPDCFYDYLNEDLGEGLRKFDAFVGDLAGWRRHLEGVNQRFDAEIGEFNKAIESYVYEDRHEAPLMTPKPAEAPTGRVGKVVKTLAGRVAGVAESLKRAPAVSGSKARRGFVIACDANYFPGVAGCVAAIRRYNSHPITFLDTGVTDAQRAALGGIVDQVVDLRHIHDLKIPTSTHTAHLNKSALSSLYAHISGYDEILYVDIDALVLGSLEPMFEALETHDIAGVRGNQLGEYFEGGQHTVGRELTEKGVAFARSLSASFDPEGVAINSGCFAVKAATLKSWEPTVAKLLTRLPEFKLVDQSILNTLLQLAKVRLALFDRSFNLMGLQFSPDAREKFELDAEIDEDACELFFAGERIRVAHFSGKKKPWMADDDSPGSLAWQWHSQGDVIERKTVAARNERRKRALVNVGIIPETPTIGRYKSGDRVRIAYMHLEAGDLNGARAWLPVDGKEAKHPPLRCAWAMLESVEGKAVEALQKLTEALPEKDEKKSRVFCERRDALAAAFGGGRRAKAGALHAPGADPKALRALPAAQRISPETELATAAGLKQAGVRVEPAALALSRKAAARRRGTAPGATRATALLEALSASPAPLVAEGANVLQIGAGSGAVLDGLAMVYGARPFALDPVPELNDSVVARRIADPETRPDFYSGELKFGLIVLHDVLGRAAEPADVLRACSALLGAGGAVMVSDPRGNDGALEGLVLHPARRSFDWRSLTDLAVSAGLERSGSYLVDGLPVYLLKAGPNPSETPADVASSSLIALAGGAPARSGLSPARAEVDAQAVRRWLAGPRGEAARKRSVSLKFQSGSPSISVVSETLAGALASKLIPATKIARLDFEPNAPISAGVKTAEAIHVQLEGLDGLPGALSEGLGSVNASKIAVTGVSLERLGDACAPALAALAARGASIGALTTGSVDRLQALLPAEHAHRVHYLPPVAFARPALARHIAEASGGGTRLIGLNLSAPTLQARYGRELPEIADRLVRLVRRLEEFGYAFRYVSHSAEDVALGLLLKRTCPGVSHVALAGRTPVEIHRAYRTMDAFVGARAEPAFWALGLGIPTRILAGDALAASLLDDVGRPGWMVDPADVEFSDKARALIEAAVSPDAREDVRLVGRRLLAQHDFAVDLISRDVSA